MPERTSANDFFQVSRMYGDFFKIVGSAAVFDDFTEGLLTGNFRHLGSPFYEGSIVNKPLALGDWLLAFGS